MCRLSKGIVIGGLGLVIVIAAIAGITVYFTSGGDKAASTTLAPATAAPTTLAPVTAAPTTLAPVTAAPTTRSPLPPPPPTPPPSPTARVEHGLLEGLWRQPVNTKNPEYAAFFGIPYALPPVGALRFKGPKPMAAWQGTRSAKKEAAICMQAVGVETGASEDCLYLNVYVPKEQQLQQQQQQLTDQARLPVYVFVHGGTFLGGSPAADRYGPDAFITQDIIVVTLQYRMNSFGFLSFDTEELPGNCGLKDLVAGMQWVKRNIAAFGGDPDKVTVGGQSAGGGLASWLTVLPETEGTFRSAIIQSGTSYHNWAYRENHVDVALRLATLVAGKAVTDIKEATDLLMAVDGDILARHTTAMAAQELRGQPELPFRPTPERRQPLVGGEPLLVVRDSESYYLQPTARRVPQILSITNEEWRLYYYRNNPTSDPAIDQQFLDNLVPHVPKDLIPSEDTRRLLHLSEELVNVDYNTVIEEVKAAIRTEVSPSCNLGCVMKEYFDGIWMATDTHRLAMFRAQDKTVPTYLLRVAVRTEMGQPLLPATPGLVPDDERNAVVHGDDLPFTWTFQEVTRTEGGFSYIASERLATLWGNFIKFGNPTPGRTELLPVEWLPNESTSADVTFLEFARDLELKTGSLSGRLISFWVDLYRKYRTPPPVRSPGRVRSL